METKQPIHWKDEQLSAILDERGTWVVHGTTKILGVATSLRRSLLKADTFTNAGDPVTAITRVPPRRVFIFSDQAARLMKVLEGEKTA
jgi:hypothetical protein